MIKKIFLIPCFIMGIFIVGFLITSVSVYAQCEKIKNPTEERVKQCKADNAEMHKICDQKRSCKGVKDPKTAIDYALTGERCADARKKQAIKWFGSIDADHQKVIKEVREVIDACNDKAKELKKQALEKEKEEREKKRKQEEQNKKGK